jgi:hypothetical protein
MRIAEFKITRRTMSAPFLNLTVALIVLSAVAIPSRVAGQTEAPDQTPPPGSPTGAPPQAPAPAPIPQPPPRPIGRCPGSFYFLT